MDQDANEAREARRAAYRARERIKASRAFDRYLGDLYGEIFDERYRTSLHHDPQEDEE